jgi:hypothetical protein
MKMFEDSVAALAETGIALRKEAVNQIGASSQPEDEA